MGKIILYVAIFVGFVSAFSCVDDVQEEGEHHAYYTLINKSDFDVRLKYYESPLYGEPNQYDTLIKRDSSYTMEIVWDIIGPPFKWVDTLFVRYGEFEFCTTRNEHLSIVRFSDPYYYECLEESYYTRRATYTITNADYEYSQQKLAEREANRGDE
ncbi:MAG: hypothetical protein J6Y37_10515 [Paludibacteraceae bacterium]|nr:hypothetical protein [Paludibacteraceae bacterium]